MKKVIAGCVGLLLFSCQLLNPELGGIFFTLANIPGRSDVAGSWIYATDNLGNVLDVEENSGGTTTLRSMFHIPDSINVTLVMPFNDGTIWLTTYAGIPRNSKIQASLNNFPSQGTTLGNATLSVSDFPENHCSGDVMWFSDGIFGLPLEKYSQDTHTASRSWLLWQGYDSILASGYNACTPVFHWFSKVRSNDQPTVSFSTFTPYSKTISINYQGVITAGYIVGHPTLIPQQGGYYFGSLFGADSHNNNGSATIGYMDGYVQYTTYMALSAPNGATIVYEKTGTPSPNVTIPAFDFKLTDKTMKNLNFSFSGDYTYKIVRWNNGTKKPVVQWRVFTAKESFPHMGTIPGSLTSRYPSLKQDLQYAGIDFIKSLDGSGYDNLVINSLTIGVRRPMERITFSCF